MMKRIILAIAVFVDSVYLYEIWGSENEVEKARDSLVKSIKSMRIGTFWDYVFTPSLWF